MQAVKTRLSEPTPDDNWVWKESLTFLAAEGQANVIFSSEPLDPSVDLERYTSG